jgi:hypothetical protein
MNIVIEDGFTDRLVLGLIRLKYATALLALGALGASILAPLPASAQAWPAKPIRLVVPYPPGGGTDLLGRMVARRLSESLGVPILIDNRPGADGSIGTDIVAKATGDGYTLLIDGTSQAYNVAFRKKLPYDSARDLAPIVQTANQQVLLVASMRLPVRNLLELIEHAKANPDERRGCAASPCARRQASPAGYRRQPAFAVDARLPDDRRGGNPGLPDAAVERPVRAAPDAARDHRTDQPRRGGDPAGSSDAQADDRRRIRPGERTEHARAVGGAGGRGGSQVEPHRHADGPEVRLILARPVFHPGIHA